MPCPEEPTRAGESRPRGRTRRFFCFWGSVQLAYGDMALIAAEVPDGSLLVDCFQALDLPSCLQLAALGYGPPPAHAHARGHGHGGEREAR